LGTANERAFIKKLLFKVVIEPGHSHLLPTENSACIRLSVGVRFNARSLSPAVGDDRQPPFSSDQRGIQSQSTARRIERPARAAKEGKTVGQKIATD
jgi:hypothetical protein